MKKIISAIAALLTIINIVPVLCISAAAKNYASGWQGDPAKSGLIDDADIFDERQEAELNEAIQEAAEKLELNILIYAAGSESRMSDSQTEIFADDAYDELYGEDTDGVFYFMDFTGKRPAYDYISTSGTAVLFYQRHIDTIFNRMDSYLPPSSVSDYKEYSYKIASGIEFFLTQLEEYSGRHKSVFDYYYDTSSGKYFYYSRGELVVSKHMPPFKMFKLFMISLFFGSIVSVIVFFSTKSTYKFKSSTNANVYISKEEINKQDWSDNFIRTYTTKTRIESSSGGGGGGGGGGGHSHSGGHGGGGHHR